MPSIGRFQSRFLQDHWESAAQRNFLVPEHILAPAWRTLGVAFARVSLSPIRTCPSRYPLLGEHTFFEQDQRICESPRLYYRADRQKLLSRAAFYNRLCTAYPQVRFYVFPVLMVADLYVVAGAYGPRADAWFAGDRYVRDFRTLLDSSIGYTWAAEGLPGMEAVSWYYRTDHHWDFEGAYKAYCQIWRLFHSRNPQTGELLLGREWAELPDLRFYGSYARRAGYFDQVSDAILDAQFDMPELKVHVYQAGHQDRNYRNRKSQYKAGNYSTAKFANHYGEYFGGDFGLVKYTCESGSGNLLIVSDSYDNCIEPLLASHFRHSFFVDLRLYAMHVGCDFVIEDFIEQNEITDVLFAGNQFWVLGLAPLEPYGAL